MAIATSVLVINICCRSAPPRLSLIDSILRVAPCCDVTASVARQEGPYLWVGSLYPEDPTVRPRSALALQDLVQLSQACTASYRDAGLHSLLHAVANTKQGTLTQLASLGLRAFAARPLP